MYEDLYIKWNGKAIQLSMMLYTIASPTQHWKTENDDLRSDFGEPKMEKPKKFAIYFSKL